VTPEWLTPAAIFAVPNTNKELRKKRAKNSPSTFLSFTSVNGGLKAAFAHECRTPVNAHERP
jgi:hypothetical protein